MKSFEVRNERIEGILKEIGRVLKAKLPQGWGFMLFIFSYGEGGSNFYISNGERKDVVAAMKEFIERNEHEPPPEKRRQVRIEVEKLLPKCTGGAGEDNPAGYRACVWCGLIEGPASDFHRPDCPVIKLHHLVHEL